jgi:hypothetical protein
MVTQRTPKQWSAWLECFVLRPAQGNIERIAKYLPVDPKAVHEVLRAIEIFTEHVKQASGRK